MRRSALALVASLALAGCASVTHVTPRGDAVSPTRALARERAHMAAIDAGRPWHEDAREAADTAELP